MTAFEDTFSHIVTGWARETLTGIPRPDGADTHPDDTGTWALTERLARHLDSEPRGAERSFDPLLARLHVHLGFEEHPQAADLLAAWPALTAQLPPF